MRRHAVLQHGCFYNSMEINIYLCKHLFTLLCVTVSSWTSPFLVQTHDDRVRTRPKIKKNISGATFHVPLTKSATLNRLLHCRLWQFWGVLFFLFRGLFFAFRGRNRPEPPCNFFPGAHTVRMTALDIQVSLCNPMAFVLEDGCLWKCSTGTVMSVCSDIMIWLPLTCDLYT